MHLDSGSNGTRSGFGELDTSLPFESQSRGYRIVDCASGNGDARNPVYVGQGIAPEAEGADVLEVLESGELARVCWTPKGIVVANSNAGAIVSDPDPA